MKTPGSFHIGNEKGIALVTAMIILLALTLMGVMMVNAMKLETKFSSAQKDETQAILLAEAGVAQVREWFQFPGRFSPSDAQITGGISIPANLGAYLDCTNLSNNQVLIVPDMSTCSSHGLSAATAPNFFKRRFVTNNRWEYINGSNFSQFADTNGDGTMDSYNKMDGDSTDTPALRITNPLYLNALFGNSSDKDLSSIGKIIRIEIYHPMGAGNSPLPKPRAICNVRVTAQTASGFIKTIEAEIWESIFMPLSAGAEAGGAAGWNGNGMVHWGNILTKNNVNMNFSSLPKRCNGASPLTWPAGDPWFNAKIEGTVTMTGSGTANNCSDCIGCTGINNAVSRPWNDVAVYQGQSVTLDNWNHSDMKDYALGMNSYYKMTSSTIIYQSNANGDLLEPHWTDITDFLKWSGKPEVVYIDATGVAGQTIDVSINGSFYSKGNIFIEGSVQFIGSGTGQTITVTDPDGTSRSLADINFEGVLYATGDLRGGGSPKIFGGMVAEGGLNSSGNPEVWYDIELMTGKKNLPRTGKGRWREALN